MSIDPYKKNLQTYLASNNIRLFVLVDKVDEFVIKGDYKIQRIVLQALLETQKSYLDYKNINFKLFIRCDLFKRLKYDVIGHDKVTAKKVDLVWTDEDIRRLIAQRIYYNYYYVLGIQSLIFPEVNDLDLYIDELSVHNESEPNNVKNKTNIISKFINIFIKSSVEKSKTKNQREAEGRRVAFNDERNKQIITSIFPKVINHFDRIGSTKDISIFEFFKTHFSLASGNTTPRLIVMYLDKCTEIAREYYRNNPDQEVTLDENHEYPLFKKIILQSAYLEFRKEVAESFTQISSAWKESFNLFILKKGKKNKFSYDEINKLLALDQEEARSFIAFLCHSGYLRCENPRNIHAERKYSIPILFHES